MMDAVAGARRTPRRHETGGVPPKPPATILFSLSVAPGVLGLRFALPEALRRHFLHAVAAAVFFVHVAAATSAWCRGTSQRCIAFQMFLQLQTLRRHVSRLVAAGVSQGISLPWTCGFSSMVTSALLVFRNSIVNGLR